MFVEVVRLFVVFLATAGGFALGVVEQGVGGGNGAVIGATLGAPWATWWVAQSAGCCGGPWA